MHRGSSMCYAVGVCRKCCGVPRGVVRWERELSTAMEKVGAEEICVRGACVLNHSGQVDEDRYEAPPLLVRKVVRSAKKVGPEVCRATLEPAASGGVRVRGDEGL